MRLRRIALASLVVVGWLAARADAYPQFQLAGDATCSGCHLSPAGGGLLSENGLAAAETMSQWGTEPAFLMGKVPAPDWLVLGGDLRGAAGVDGAPDVRAVMFPMQAELYAAASHDAWSVHVTAGARDPEYRRTAATLFTSREHWLQWQQEPGTPFGLFVRAGRFMPVYGLRFAEHPFFDRRFGGTPLYGEAYAAAAEYITEAWEVHATAFVHDPFLATTELGNGAAVYAETRVAPEVAVGVEGKLDVTHDDRRIYGGVTAKHYVAPAHLLLQTELELVHQKIDAGGTDNQLVGVLVGSYTIGAVMIDLGLDAWAPSLHVRYLDQEALDLNVHWFVTSHVELIATNRFQMLELGAGGPSSGYSLLQLHVRL